MLAMEATAAIVVEVLLPSIRIYACSSVKSAEWWKVTLILIR